MRNVLFATAIAIGALSLAGCSKNTEEKADEATESAAADAQANAEDATAAATDAKNTAEANVQGESKKKAAAD